MPSIKAWMLERQKRRQAAALVIQAKCRQVLSLISIQSYIEDRDRLIKLADIRRRLAIATFRVHLRGKVIRLKINKARKTYQEGKQKTYPDSPSLGSFADKLRVDKTLASRKTSMQVDEFSAMSVTNTDFSPKILSKRPDILDVEELSFSSEEGRGGDVYRPYYRGHIKGYLMPTDSYKNKWRTADFHQTKTKEDPDGFIDMMSLRDDASLAPLFISPEPYVRGATAELTRTQPTYDSIKTQTSTRKMKVPPVLRRGRRPEEFLRPTTVSMLKADIQQAKKAKLTVSTEAKYKQIAAKSTRPVSVSPVFVSRRRPKAKAKSVLPVIVTPPPPLIFKDAYTAPQLHSLSFEQALPKLHRFVERYCSSPSGSKRHKQLV
jgi:hypothetical protein